jgi:hypothetical protein
MRSLYRIVFVAGMGLILASCVTKGQHFQSNISWIKQNVTTKKDVTFKLKSPTAVGNSGGTETWTYGFYKYRLIGKSPTKELKLYWNPDGTIRHFSFNSSFPEDIGSQSSGGAGMPGGDLENK